MNNSTSRTVTAVLLHCFLVGGIQHANTSALHDDFLEIVAYVGAQSVWSRDGIQALFTDRNGKLIPLSLSGKVRGGDENALRVVFQGNVVAVGSDECKNLISGIRELRGSYSGKDAWKNSRVELLLRMLTNDPSISGVDARSLQDHQPHKEVFREIQLLQERNKKDGP